MQGHVERLNEDGTAQVRVRGDEAGTSCGDHGGGCHACGNKPQFTIKVGNDAGARAGDYVSIHYPQGAQLKSLGIFFGIPGLGILTGLAVWAMLQKGQAFTDVTAVSAAALCFVLAIVASARIYRRLSPQIQPYIARVLTAGPGPISSLHVIDPVCKMPVDPASAAAKLAYEGQTYYFCHAHCLEAFAKEPAAYV
jgi:YHS domain-containing protein/positive regulator of sigma E activity